MLCLLLLWNTYTNSESDYALENVHFDVKYMSFVLSWQKDTSMLFLYITISIFLPFSYTNKPLFSDLQLHLSSFFMPLRV